MPLSDKPSSNKKLLGNHSSDNEGPETGESSPDSPEERQADKTVRKVIKLFKEFGNVNYVTSNVTLMEHSLQAAELALQHFNSSDKTIDEELVIGALLHDFGKIVIMYKDKHGLELPERG